MQVLIDGVPAESSYGDEIVIDLSGRKHLYFVDVTYYDKYNTRVDRFYRDENGKIVWVDCAPYEEGTYTAKAWLIYNDFADDTEERVEISAPITIHSHKATEAVIENAGQSVRINAGAPTIPAIIAKAQAPLIKRLTWL